MDKTMDKGGEAAGRSASRILFIGGTPNAALEGPIRAGMRARRIDAFLNSFTGEYRRDDSGDVSRAARVTISRDPDVKS